MAVSIQAQIEKLQLSIKGLEAQRSILGDEIVDPALAALRQQLAALEQQVATEATPSEERRMVTILFTDMVGSTSMAEKLDPEQWRQIVSRVHTSPGEVIAIHHGTVAQYLGDGLLAFFGSKQASEHDPENAIRAALDGHTAVAGLDLAEKVQLRAGIHTGLVVVGELGDAIHKELTASGDAMNLAARLQSAAPPGGTLISHDTYRYVRGVFDLTPRPPLTVKGKSEPLQTYLVRGAKPRPFRSVSRGVAGVETRTIGREAEMQALKQAYLRAYEGHGVVWAQLLSDPGVGKSRLLTDLSDWMDLREETYRLLRARAFPDDANQPFAMVRRMWFDRFQIAEDTPLPQAETKWVDRFKEFYEQDDCDEAAHALGLLVGLSFLESPYIKGMRDDPTQVKGRALVVSRDLVRAVRQHDPLVLLLEDLQWTDLTSWEYLMEVFLGGDEAESPHGLFILGAARPEWQPPQELTKLFESSMSADQSSKRWATLLNLAPLTDQATRQLVLELLRRVKDVPDTVIDQLVDRSEGIPYFTEEIINWFIDHGILDTRGEEWQFSPEKLKEQPLPATLQHLLLTRISSLSTTERAALQRGAIFGRRFWTGGVEALGASSGAEVLGHLQPRGFIEVQPESSFQGDTEWSFQQNLLQEVTYESVLKRERATLHKVAASWLERQARQAGRLEEFAGLLGDHCVRAGELSSAADWYLLAGKRAFSQGAPREANGFYKQALDLLPPVDYDRRWKVLLGREEALAVLGDADPWRSEVNALLELSHHFEDENYLAEAYLRQAICRNRTGDFSVSEQAIREALAAARRCGNEIIEIKALALSASVGVTRDNKSTVLRDNLEEALERARHLGDENVLSFVLYRAYFYYGELPDIARGFPLALEQVELEHRLGNRSEEARGLGNLGIIYNAMGLYKQGRPLIEQALQICKALGARRSLAYNLGNLGEMYYRTGDLHSARQLMEEALKEISPTQDDRGKAFVLNDLGKILLAIGDVPGASRRFSEAYEWSISHQLPGQACESRIGLAACAVMQGSLEEARKQIYAALDHLKEKGIMGLNDPGWDITTCAEIFDAIGEPENATDVLERGYQGLIEVADTINVPEWRQSFLENVPENRALIEMWERRKL